jgi:hypothetical protein
LRRGRRSLEKSGGRSLEYWTGKWRSLLERWRIEERKEIIGEEWRKISRILDR